ncbi:MAG: cytochrome c [Gemmataceae bacterium]
MTHKLPVGLAGLALLVVGLVAWRGTDHGTAADAQPAAPVLPANDFELLVQHTARLLRTTLDDLPKADAKEQKLAVTKARVAALMLAACAQYTAKGDNAGQVAAVQPLALQVAADLQAGQFDAAKKNAALLTSAKGQPAPLAKVDYAKLMELDELMRPFEQVQKGGLDFERTLLLLVSTGRKGKALPDKAMDDQLVFLAYQTAVAGELTKLYTPTMKPEEWKALCDQMSQSALELGQAVKAKDGKAGYAALRALNQSCDKCHEVYR